MELMETKQAAKSAVERSPAHHHFEQARCGLPALPHQALLAPPAVWEFEPYGCHPCHTDVGWAPLASCFSKHWSAQDGFPTSMDDSTCNCHSTPFSQSQKRKLDLDYYFSNQWARKPVLGTVKADVTSDAIGRKNLNAKWFWQSNWHEKLSIAER